MPIKKDNLSAAGEYAVASEVCRRDFYAQVTLGHLKRTDILVFNVETDKQLTIEVKTKQGSEWPGIKGIPNGNTLLIFVDFQNKRDDERPDFYILDGKDWQQFLRQYVIPHGSVRIDGGYVPVWGPPRYKPYEGVGVKPHLIEFCKEKWEKLEKKLRN